MTIAFEPIGLFHCVARYPYDAPRQPGLSHGATGVVELNTGHNYEQALQDLEGFSRIWLIYCFDRNPNWKPMVQPPRASRKVGVFASRAPYRPNPIGISCVTLIGVSGRKIEVGEHDLLDGTPILDIKPYVPYADCFPEAACGWLDEVDSIQWQVNFAPEAEAQLEGLEAQGLASLRPFLLQQLAENPLDQRKKRLRPLQADTWELAYRTWRIRFNADDVTQSLSITSIASGYSPVELASDDDPYSDKAMHREFVRSFPF